MWQLEENVVLFEVGGFKKKCFKENYTEPASMVPGLLPHTEKSDEEKFWFLLSGREKQSALQQFEGGGLMMCGTSTAKAKTKVTEKKFLH